MWKGNISNPAPNPIEQPSSNSEVKVATNRAFNIRRDQDKVKNFTVSLIDIDESIFNYINDVINVHVTDNAESVKVPLHYASPEKWDAIQKDGVLRDQQGKLQLPAMVFKRSSHEKNMELHTFNRHLIYGIVQKFSEKNKYDNFCLLNSGAAPMNQVFGVTLPDHVIIKYEFICWADYVEQVNSMVEKINFAAYEYWGDPKRFKFRVYINDYNYTTENSADQDRLVKATFDLSVYAYLLPDAKENRESTMKRLMTPRVIKINMETVLSGELDDINNALKNTSNKKSFPYTYKDGVGMVPDGQNFRFPVPSFGTTNIIVCPTVPASSTSTGTEGSLAFDSSFCYIFVNGIWKRHGGQDFGAFRNTPLEVPQLWHTPPTSPGDPGQEGWQAYDNLFHYIYVNGQWKRDLLSDWT